VESKIGTNSLPAMDVICYVVCLTVSLFCANFRDENLSFVWQRVERQNMDEQLTTNASMQGKGFTLLPGVHIPASKLSELKALGYQISDQSSISLPKSQQLCRWGAACKRKDCTYRHERQEAAWEEPNPSTELTWGWSPARTGHERHGSRSSTGSGSGSGSPPSSNQSSPRQTSPEVRLCRYGADCKRPSCRFVHPQPLELSPSPAERAGSLDFYSNVAEAEYLTTVRNGETMLLSPTTDSGASSPSRPAAVALGSAPDAHNNMSVATRALAANSSRFNWAPRPLSAAAAEFVPVAAS